ncbi:unnamed protein product [Streptococcus phage TP-778L]|jgi:hypothetical protein|uniref:Peptidase C51 domain-containing protein n=1 Tax=Streptococcus phage TP-778L TaxID=1385385 RepID=U6E9D5_9CAUD|nr:host range and adsorption protein [Streptococcus phage TP-778L]AZF92758.1 capsid and scaffold protein [Streptococcus phage CHPC933]CDG41671.1 unnamed protein product [Streptococcus phage TP-778L]
MLLTIHDNNLQKVAYIDNDKQSTLNFFNDKWTRLLESGTSVFEFSVFKKSITSNYNVETAYKYLNERAFVSFKYKGRSYLFNVMKVEEDENIIRCYCENLSLELLLEYRGAYKASKPMTFKEYFDDWGMGQVAKLTLGVNEVSDQKRTLEWEGQETTLARLISLARNFDAEIEFETKLQPNSQLDVFVLNVYKAHDGINQGVGRRRSDVILKYGKNINGIKRSVDKTQIYNMTTPYGRKDDTKKETKRISDPVTIQNPVVVPSARVEKRYAGGDLTYAGHTLSASLVQTIFNLCVQRNLLPSGVISQLYLESFWGSSNVARRDNNWSGMTGGAQTRPSGVVVTTGSPRPASEGGTYMHYASVDDFMKDYTYLLAEQTSGGRKMYGVKGKQNIEEYTKGLFRIGGALYDYAAAGYNHYIYLMRDIRSGINRSNGNILDKLDDLWRQPDNQVTQPNQPITRTVKAEKVIAVLNEMQGLKGRRVGNGQCYALAAWYSMKLGGPGLGAGVTGKSGVIGAGMAAAKIGTDYAWDRFGWSVIRPTSVDQLKPGALANIKAYNSFLGTTVWGHNSIIIANNGSTVTVLEQNYAGRQYVVQNSYPASAYLGAIETLCYPPELREGKTVEGRTETVSSPNFEVQKVEIPPIDVEVTSESTAALTIDSKRKQEWKNDKGQVEFYLENGSLYAPISKELYPSILTGKENDDNWIRKDMEIDTDSEDVLISTALRNLRKFCYPAITYEVDGFLDLDIGDTVKIQDDGFKPMLILEARVSEQEISFSNPVENKTVFANFQALQNKVSDSLLSRMAKLAEQAIPYELKLSTDKGTTFKNSIGQSVLKATLEKNGEVYQPIFFYKNGDSIIGTGNQLVVKPTDFENTLQVTVEAYLDDELVATAEVTFTDVSDGEQGPKGDRGNDGLPGKDGVGLKTTTITYGLSDSDSTQPTDWTSQPPTLIKGKYLWTKTVWTYTDSSSETGYQKTYIAKDGNKGNDGIPGKDGVGIRNTTITYAAGTSGTVAPTSGWSSQVPNVPESNYLWTKTVWEYTDNTNETGYSVAKMGEQGPKGDRGIQGLQGPRGDQGIPGPKGIDGTDAPTIFVKSYTYSAGSKAYIKLTGPNAFEQTLYYSRGHNVWVLDATTHKLKEFVHCDTYITMSFNHNGVNITLADYLNSITDSIVAIAASDADAVDQNFRDVLNKMGGNPELGTWSGRTGHVFIGMSKRSDGTWPLQPRQGYEVAIQEDGSAPEIGCTLSIGGIVANGADGKTQYTHIAYANSADGSKDFSTSDSNRAYIGMYVDFNINDSTNPSDYSWTLVKGADGTQGVPGKPGADGKTPYFHTAWAYSADGTDGFTTVYPNLNLLEGTATFDGMNPNSSDNSVSAITKTKISGIANTVMDVKTSGNAFAVGFYTQKGYNITAGQTITISFIAKASSDTSLFVGFEHFPSGHKTFTISTKWELYTYTFTATTSGTPTFVMYGWDMVAGQGFQLYNPKAELGSVATPWMPSASEVTTADYPSFIGQYTNYTQVDSPNPRDYTWSLIRGNDGKQGPQGPKGDRGIPGIKGADGRTQYTHIAYADTISGSGFSQTDVNKAYIGMYQDFNAEDSKNPQDYRWSKWKGSDGRDGIPGKAGADGRTPYVHFAYADSADGQKGFSLTQTGRKRYLGVLTNFFKEDSTNPSDYTWNDTAGSISVGGRNLLVKTNQGITNWNWQLSDGDKSVEEVKVDGIRAVKLIKGSTAANTGWNFIEYNGLLRELIQPKSKYVLSFDVKPSVDVTFYATLARGDFNEPLTDTVAMPKALANQWNKVSCVLTSKETLPNIAWQVVYLAGMPTTNGNWVIIKNIKLEEGDIPTQWTPAIEDIQDEIDSKADAAMTIEQINALNERAGIIKAEMEAKASAEILNNWIKNYQDFVKANETERAAAEKALVSSSQRVSTIAKELGELSDRWNFIDTYMNSSNDGLVIGKNDGSSSMMFNPNGRISMYSAGEEVMYISQGVIHIENGIFSKTIQVGRYREEQYHLNPDMNVIRYVGGF